MLSNVAILILLFCHLFLSVYVCMRDACAHLDALFAFPGVLWSIGFYTVFFLTVCLSSTIDGALASCRGQIITCTSIDIIERE